MLPFPLYPKTRYSALGIIRADLSLCRVGSQGHQREHRQPDRLPPPRRHSETEIVCEQESAVSAYQGQARGVPAEEGERGWVSDGVVEGGVSGENGDALR